MPGWATPYALLLWGGLGGFDPQRRRAREWLVGLEGRPQPLSAEGRGMIGHDPTLVGWPWVTETHSWLEPTALAILALCREGLVEHPRVGWGIGLIVNRAIPGGGWNYGNKTMFGRTLRPQPGPTGLALLALAARSLDIRRPGRARLPARGGPESTSSGLARLGHYRFASLPRLPGGGRLLARGIVP